MNQTFNMTLPISKIDEEQRMVYGVATTEDLDVQGDIVDYEASKRAFSNWLGNIREMHEPKAVGKAIDIQFDDVNKQVILGAKISESADGEGAWIKCKEGILTGFSIGGSVNTIATEKVGDKKVNRIMDYDLAETSLVDNPANPAAKFIMVKSFDGGLNRVEVTEKAARPHAIAWWHKYFMARPMASQDSQYNQAEKSKRVEMKKSTWDAAWLIDLACNLSSYISMEEYEGEDMDSLIGALEEIKAAAAKELSEPYPKLESAIELASKALDIKKGTDMSKKVEKGNVNGGEERDINADVTETQEEAGRPVNDTTERATDAGVAPAGEVIEEAGEEAVQPVVHAEGTAAADAKTGADNLPEEDKDAEVVADEDKKEIGAEADATDKSSDEGEDDAEKSTVIQDLVKSVSGLEKAMADKESSELAKAVGAMKDEVVTIVKGLEGRIAALEGQPVASKAKASYVDVAKSAEDGTTTDDAEVQEVVKRAEEIAKSPQLSKHAGEPMELALKLRKFQAEGRLTK